jgi:hypothetical protein
LALVVLVLGGFLIWAPPAEGEGCLTGFRSHCIDPLVA